MFEVRQSICVTGVNREAVIKVKSLIASVTSEPLPLESFHVKRRSDLTDGAMLVPKVVLAAAHCPGQRFIDQTPASGGQLDFLYDEICKIGGKSTICSPLPKGIYPLDTLRKPHPPPMSNPLHRRTTSCT